MAGPSVRGLGGRLHVFWLLLYNRVCRELSYAGCLCRPTRADYHPQPLLFNSYINDLPSIVQSDMILYADDSVVYVSANTLHEACQLVQTDLNGIGTWCKYHELSKKTKAMLFGVTDVTPAIDNNIGILQNRIEFVNTFKYLGIHLDPKMSFHHQFKETYKLASFKLLLLKRVRPVITEFTALIIVKSMLLPYLDMGNLFLSSQPLNELSKLDVILNTALRTVHNIYIPRDVHMLDIYTRAYLFPLLYRRKYSLLSLIHRLLSTSQIDRA